MNLSTILQAIPHLTTNERKALRAALDSFIDPDDELDVEYLHAIQTITGERIAMVPFKAGKNYQVWMKNQPVIERVYRAVIADAPLNRVKRLALKQLLMQLLVDWIKDNKQPLTLPNICKQLGNMEMIADQSFPGYLSNGMGFLILNAIGGANGT